MIEQIFYVFGSSSSIDYDVLVLVQNIPDIHAAHDWCDEFEENLQDEFLDKKINVNLGILKDGVIIKSFKGTADEVNNSVFATYTLHTQLHPLQITHMIPRDFHLKILRAARIILTFLSRTQYKDKVKASLRHDLTEKLQALRAIDFTTIMGLGDKNVSLIDFKKICAFQIGQCLGLANKKELYTKESICEEYPELIGAINRQPSSMATLEIYKNKFLDLAERELPKMSKLVE